MFKINKQMHRETKILKFIRIINTLVSPGLPNTNSFCNNVQSVQPLTPKTNSFWWKEYISLAQL